MTNPTSNFGWQMPTSTDLVTDLPADFEVFGQAVDTSLADLKGGTTGQVLAKNSDTDMDFVWSNDAAGMTNPMTTTGDTIYSSSGSTPARLGIGSTGQVLTVSGGVPAWTTPAGGQSWTQVATGSTTSGSSLALTSLSGYDNYLLMWNDVQVTSSGRPSYTIRFNADSGANYDYSLVRQTSSTTAGAGAFSATQSHADNIYMDNGLSNFIAVRISGCKSTTGFKTFTNQLATITNAGVAANVISSGIYKSNSAITSINLALASNTFIQGTYYLYGSN